jgi:DNA-binding transcriptional MerR regulator
LSVSVESRELLLQKNFFKQEADMELYGINAVSKETGIHESSLRRWETTGLICPGRVDLGKTTVRVFTREDMDTLKKVKDLMDSGIKIRTAFEWVRGDGHPGQDDEA